MSRKLSLLFIAAIISFKGRAQVSPEITSWIRNTTGATGYAGIPSNVQLVQYTAADVYISANCIPGYAIGPWPGNPNIPTNMNFVYKITRTPAPNTGTPTPVGLGHVGVWTNGVSIFNARDAMSYNNLGIWNQNAYFFEGPGFDNCLGHPAPNGEYHHHVSPKCLYDITDNTRHSPIIGYAFDGYPVYGAYAFTNTDGSGPIKRMASSYQLRTITQRHTKPDGTALTAPQYGPAINTTYPLGAYQEDYIYTPGSGDLDEHNGRWCKTPEYPSGTYCYFVTLDASLMPQYPYTLGLTYHGIVPPGNTGPMGGHNVPPGATTVYSGTTAVNDIAASAFSAEIFPNPADNYINLFIQPTTGNNFSVTLLDMNGKAVFVQSNVQPAILYSLDVAGIPAGIYVINIHSEAANYKQKVVLAK